ncbi:Uncharacterized protein BP5553_08440 [Venustampulla echinocandica]|uniref:Beta-lactamase-related domain-containing protein n=1 Tax=Venustampulla echinocandica TaxID=2656787 RepID=A0A370TEA6_9HELO|nr:Uncharacterized protein BP5553_08440 [Venustampulla echinocandica]RDL33001.1 Uncharacterized protein BP5553_08440 [Venustampulla echinocandica]
MELKNMDELIQRLKNLEPRLQELSRISGIPGCSIGVMHEGQAIWKANIGYRNVELSLKTQSDTVYNLDSITKGMTAAAFGLLVAEGKVEWTTPLKDIIPEFASLGDELDKQLTPLDLLSMRSGNTMLDSMSWQGNNYIFFKKSETIALWNATPRQGSFRSSFLYNNWGYAVIGVVIEKLSGQGLHDFLRERFFEPLQLKNTRMTDFKADENRTLCYAILDDRSPVVVPDPAIGVGTFMEGASGLLSTIDDVFVLYRAYMEAIKDQTERGTNSTDGNPFKECTTLISGHNFLGNSTSLREQAYGCAWVRCQLPGPLGMLSMNMKLMEVEPHNVMPNATEGSPSRLCLYHQGLMPGSSANVALLPETDTIVAVLVNACPLGDGADWISQAIMEVIYDAPIRHDYEAFAREAAAKVLDHLPSLKRIQEKHQLMGTKPSLPLSSYAGKYQHDKTSFWIEIAVVKECLSICFMGVEMETYELRHYQDDTFTWMISFNEAARRGRFVHYYDAAHYLIKFEGDDQGVLKLHWHCTRDTGETPYLFLKTHV